MRDFGRRAEYTWGFIAALHIGFALSIRFGERLPSRKPMSAQTRRPTGILPRFPHRGISLCKKHEVHKCPELSETRIHEFVPRSRYCALHKIAAPACEPAALD